VPSLNDRTDDIPLLADHFIDQICKEYGMPKKEIESAAIKELQQVNWTGNVREFRNIIERLIILCPKTIDKDSVKVYANPQFTA
jgi:DNA-binding NtrC family response regulator